jgi:hypothetical protein
MAPSRNRRMRVIILDKQAEVGPGGATTGELVRKIFLCRFVSLPHDTIKCCYRYERYRKSPIRECARQFNEPSEGDEQEVRQWEPASTQLSEARQEAEVHRLFGGLTYART